MSSEDVVELSVDETNELRKKLGLKPLRMGSSSSSSAPAPVPSEDLHQSSSSNKNKEEINLSVDDTNALRAKLGLAPLKTTSNSAPSGRKASEAIHAPAENNREKDEVKRRIEEAKLKREVEAGLAKLKKKGGNVASLAESGEGGATSWVEKMRQSKKEKVSTTDAIGDSNETKKKSKKKKKRKSDDAVVSKYTGDDFKDQNITVSHATNEFEAGTTTILTLADKSILEADEDGEGNALENVNMAESATAKENMKKKRMLELGLGHAGGYAGYDDDEFEENGAQLTLGGAIGSGGPGGGDDDDGKKKKKGFKLGNSIIQDEKDESEDKNDLFAGISGKSVSLVSSKSNAQQADFMTYEEEETMGINSINKVDFEKRRKKKEKKLMKKLKKKRKKSIDKDDKMEDNKQKSEKDEKTSLLDDLEGSAHQHTYKNKKNLRKRKRRQADSEDEDEENQQNSNSYKKDEDMGAEEEDAAMQTERKKKFNEIMEKGNNRTNKVFKEVKNANFETDSPKNEDEEQEGDDAFLSAALSKARRLRRLREMNTKTSNTETSNQKGADAVVQAIQAMKKETPSKESSSNGSKSGRITFELDATKEFTRTLRSQTSEPLKPKLAAKVEAKIVDSKNDETAPKPTEMEVDEEEEAASLEELAKEVKVDQDNAGGFGDTASTVPVGRGLSSFLSMLKHTGDITGKNAGMEELRGRAKDERNYEDYEKLNLKEVVKLDTSGLNGNIHEKDIEFANREIKLEYRDEHGRLLTRKEAYRNLCYQFHGHGSSKKNEERRLKQVERERSEASRASNTTGTLGALKATQRATGKAFVLHKT